MIHISKKSQFLILSNLILGIAVFVFVYWDIQESKQDLLGILEAESNTLIESLSSGIETTILTNIEMDDMLVQRLNSVAELTGFIKHFNGINYYLQEISEEFDVNVIMIIDTSGAIIAHNDIPHSLSKISEESFLELDSIFNGEYKWIELENKICPDKTNDMYLIARRRLNSTGCVIVGIEENALLEFRKKIGIGKKIADIGDNKNIIYALLQDEEGIFSASGGVDSISSITSDSFLIAAWNDTKVRSRVYNYTEESKIYEVIKGIHTDDFNFLIRIGLSLENIREINQSSMLRAILIGIGIFLTGAILLVLVFTREKFNILKEKHKTIKQSSSMILSGISDGVIVINKDNIITVFNIPASLIFNFDANETIGKKYTQVFDNDVFNIESVFTSSQNINFKEIDFRNKSGKTLNLGLSASIISDTEGEPDLVIIIIRDLTERKKIQDLLQRKEKLSAMGELAGGVAHEIRNPLNSINVIAQRFQYEFEPESDKEEYSQLVKTVRSEVGRVNNIIKQFLEFARPPKLNPGNIKIDEVLDSIINLINSQAQAKNITIEKDIQDNIIAFADREKLNQAFLNIAQNAFDAMDSGGKLKIKAVSNEDKILISFIDNGPGIPNDILPRIFNLYFTTKSDGNGLGLSIVHQIITEHDGEISCNSQLNEGSDFSIILPLKIFDKTEEKFDNIVDSSQ